MTPWLPWSTDHVDDEMGQDKGFAIHSVPEGGSKIRSSKSPGPNLASETALSDFPRTLAFIQAII
jgi:hypothetical protein